MLILTNLINQFPVAFTGVFANIPHLECVCSEFSCFEIQVDYLVEFGYHSRTCSQYRETLVRPSLETEPVYLSYPAWVQGRSLRWWLGTNHNSQNSLFSKLFPRHLLQSRLLTGSVLSDLTECVSFWASQISICNYPLLDAPSLLSQLAYCLDASSCSSLAWINKIGWFISWEKYKHHTLKLIFDKEEGWKTQ